MINLHVNGKKVNVEEGQTVLDACIEADVSVPTLCYDNRLCNGEGSCRVCMVENGDGNLVPACVTTAVKGMKILTDTEKVVKMRKMLLELIISDHNSDCMTCEKSGDCLLQDYAYEYDVDITAYRGRKKEPKIVDSNKFFYLDKSKCILCTKCVRICNELQHHNVWSILNRGFDTEVSTPFDIDIVEGNCVSCGNCVAACPVGALVPKKDVKYRAWEVKKTQTTCHYCGVGCQMNLLVKDGKVVGVEAVDDAVNNGLLCVKGRFGYHYISHEDRLKTPLIKRNGKFEEATWEEAYDLIHSRMSQIKEKHGPESIGFFGGGKATIEDNYMLQKFARAVIGTNSIDCCARL